VQYYNQGHDPDVEVLGWDSDEMLGEFVGDFCCFDEGYRLGTQLLDQGADVILSVAGDLVGEGVAEAVSEREDVYMIGVDADLSVLFPQYSSIALTSVVKDYAQSVQIALDAFEAGDFQGGPHTGTLESGEVGLAPFHENEALISAQTRTELETLRMKIVDGDIKIP
jgi:basic membrane protein A